MAELGKKLTQRKSVKKHQIPLVILGVLDENLTAERQNILIENAAKLGVRIRSWIEKPPVDEDMFFRASIQLVKEEIDPSKELE